MEITAAMIRAGVDASNRVAEFDTIATPATEEDYVEAILGAVLPLLDVPLVSDAMLPPNGPHTGAGGV